MSTTTTATLTTIDTITDEQIEALRIEAGAAGDEAQVRICRIALGYGAGYTHPTGFERRTARYDCVDAIREAELA